MKHIAVVIGMLLGCITLQAKTSPDGFRQIVVHAYDSIRIEMIKTACVIEGVKAPDFLKEISENGVDSALVHNPDAISKSMEQLIRQSDIGLRNDDIRECDSLVRTIRANLMGRLLMQNHDKENIILSSFCVHKEEMNRLREEIIDFQKAQKGGDILHFQKKHPNSKFLALIPDEKKNHDAGWKDMILIVAIISIIISTMLVMGYLIYKFRRKNRVLSNMQRMKSQEGSDNNSIRPVPQQEEPKQEKPFQNHGKDDNGLNNAEETVDAASVNAFAERNDNCVVVGTSVIGNSHISMGLPCQDNCKYAYIKDGWGIAITSDGAGSAKHSEIGSRIVVERGMHYFRSVIGQKKWIENNVLPTEAEWFNIAYTTLKVIRDDMEAFANTHKIELGSLSATIIVVIHTPWGFLTTHVGDGRAGYKDDTNEWKALISPHKGEEANQTIFLTSGFWNIPYYVMSGVMVPESHVVRCRPVAFTLMSDGCEHTAWQCNTKNEHTGIYYDPNKPFDRFFDPLVEDILKDMKPDLQTCWARFIISGNKSFKNEPDDKTMILGIIK